MHYARKGLRKWRPWPLRLALLRLVFIVPVLHSRSAPVLICLSIVRLCTFSRRRQLVAQHGDAVKLAVRAEPSPDGAPLGEITSRGRVHCVGTRGAWLRVLYQGHRVRPQILTYRRALVLRAAAGRGTLTMGFLFSFCFLVATEPFSKKARCCFVRLRLFRYFATCYGWYCGVDRRECPE